MTDKELKKLSRLELLELLLVETRENERLREELAKAKKENSIEKSALILNETVKQLESALQTVTTISADGGVMPKNTPTVSKKSNKKKPNISGLFSKASQLVKNMNKKSKPKVKKSK